MGKILSEQRIAQFNRDGYLYPIPMLSQHEVTRYRQGLAASEAWLGHPIDYPEKMKAHLLFEWMDELVHHPRILDAVEDLMGPDILLFQPTLWVKEPNNDAVVHWHQDSFYFNIEPFEYLTVWVALSDASIQAGCMNVSTGSHHEGERAHPEIELDKRLIRRAWAIRDDDLGGRGVVPMPLAAGEMSVHHALMVHASAANESDERRIGAGITYIPPHVRPLGAMRSSAMLVRGNDPFHYHEPEQRLKAGEEFTQQRVAYHREMVARYQGRQEARVAG